MAPPDFLSILRIKPWARKKRRLLRATGAAFLTFDALSPV
jgi:hypothetical protein